MYLAQNIMYTNLFDSFLAPQKKFYVISDSQLETIQRNRRQKEIDSLESSRKKLDDIYQSRIQMIEEREHELKEGLKALSSEKSSAISS